MKTITVVLVALLLPATLARWSKEEFRQDNYIEVLPPPLLPSTKHSECLLCVGEREWCARKSFLLDVQHVQLAQVRRPSKA